jgi:UDPglucose 6-dehydrogenase
MKTIGIIGYGFVGQAVKCGFEHVDNLEILIYDKYKKIGFLKDVIEKSQILFVCVPTPMDEPKDSKYGKCNIKIVKDVVRQIHVAANGQRKIIVIKSTIPPGTCEKLNKLVEGKHAIVFNPEFLTEKNWEQDFITQNPIILGVNSNENVQSLKDLYLDFSHAVRKKHTVPLAEIYISSTKEAEMSKYVLNTYFFTKVIFFNDIKKVCDADNIDYEKIRSIILKDHRMGKTHTQVPGPDGLSGAGGKCFIKDTNAFLYYIDKLGLKAKKYIIAKAWKLNLKYREVKDWEEIVGATTKNNYGDE